MIRWTNDRQIDKLGRNFNTGHCLLKVARLNSKPQEQNTVTDAEVQQVQKEKALELLATELVGATFQMGMRFSIFILRMYFPCNRIGGLCTLSTKAAAGSKSLQPSYGTKSGTTSDLLCKTSSAWTGENTLAEGWAGLVKSWMTACTLLQSKRSLTEDVSRVFPSTSRSMYGQGWPQILSVHPQLHHVQ
jgi:hypothetical protein